MSHIFQIINEISGSITEYQSEDEIAVTGCFQVYSERYGNNFDYTNRAERTVALKEALLDFANNVLE